MNLYKELYICTSITNSTYEYFTNCIFEIDDPHLGCTASIFIICLVHLSNFSPFLKFLSMLEISLYIRNFSLCLYFLSIFVILDYHHRDRKVQRLLSRTLHMNIHASRTLRMNVSRTPYMNYIIIIIVTGRCSAFCRELYI